MTACLVPEMGSFSMLQLRWEGATMENAVSIRWS
jgi:hypothetical protein